MGGIAALMPSAPAKKPEEKKEKKEDGKEGEDEDKKDEDADEDDKKEKKDAKKEKATEKSQKEDPTSSSGASLYFGMLSVVCVAMVSAVRTCVCAPIANANTDTRAITKRFVS